MLGVVVEALLLLKIIIIDVEEVTNLFHAEGNTDCSVTDILVFFSGWANYHHCDFPSPKVSFCMGKQQNYAQ